MKLITLKSWLISLSAIAISSFSFAGDFRSKKDYLSFFIPVQLNKLDPITTINAHTKATLALVYEQLIIVNASQELQPALAKSWYIDSENKSVSITINPNHRFSDNTEVTALDVINSFKRLCSRHSKALGEVRGLKGCHTKSKSGKTEPEITQLSRYKVKFNINCSPTTFLYQLSSPSTVIVKEANDGRLIGSGAYLVERKNQKEIILGRNPFYYDSDKIKNRGLIFISTDGRLSSILEKNNIDGALMYRQESLANLNYKKFKLIKSNPNITEILVLNNQKFPFNQLVFRKALASEIYNNFDPGDAVGSHQAYGVIPYGMGGSMSNIKPDKLDLISPSNVIEKIPNLATKKTVVTVHVLEDIKNSRISTKIIEAGNKYNLDIKFKYHRDYITLLKHYHDHSLDAFIDLYVFKNRDAYRILEYFSKSGENHANINDNQIDKMLNEAVAMPSSHGKFQLCRQINAYLQDNAIVIPLFYMDHGNLLNKCLTGISDDFFFDPFYQLPHLSKSDNCET